MEDTRDMRRGWGRGGPGVSTGTAVAPAPSDIRTAVLAALEESPAHGYEIIQRFEEKTAGMWRPSAGSIYPTSLLEDEGLVRSYERDGKKVYELTDEGRAPRLGAEEAGAPGPQGRSAATTETSATPCASSLASKQAAMTGNPDTMGKVRSRSSPTPEADTPPRGGAEPAAIASPAAARPGGALPPRPTPPRSRHRRRSA